MADFFAQQFTVASPQTVDRDTQRALTPAEAGSGANERVGVVSAEERAPLVEQLRPGVRGAVGALEKRGVEYDRLDDREITFKITEREKWQQYDAVLERSISFARGLYATQILNSWGVPTVNDSQVAAICGDKLTTTLMLERAHVPQPLVKVAFTPESAITAIEEMSFPPHLSTMRSLPGPSATPLPPRFSVMW